MKLYDWALAKSEKYASKGELYGTKNSDLLANRGTGSSGVNPCGRTQCVNINLL